MYKETDALHERMKKLENEMKILKITTGGSSGEGGVEGDAMGELLKMINDLGDDLRADCDRKYVGLLTFEDHVRKNDDEHKEMQQDTNHVCIRLKLLEDYKLGKEGHDAKQDVTVAQVDKRTKAHDKQLEDIIYQLSQVSSRPSPSGLSNPISTTNNDSGDLLDRMHKELDRRLAGMGGSGDAAALAKLQEKIDAIEEKQTKDSTRLDSVNNALEKVKKELAELDGARLRRDVEKLHSSLHLFAKKADLDKVT